MKTITFGRFNIPHPGHKYIIDKADLVVISSSAKVSVGKRIDMLSKLGIAKEKLVVGNPFKEIEKAVTDSKEKVTIYYTPENIALANHFQKNNSKVSIKEVERVGNLSSTIIRSFIETNNDVELLKIYGNDTGLVNLAKEAYSQEK